MAQLSAWQDYAAHKLYLQQISIPLTVRNNIHILPGKTGVLSLTLQLNKTSFTPRHTIIGKGLAYVKPLDQNLPLRPIEIEFENNHCCIEIHNTSDSTVEFLHGQEMAYFDARSKGLVQINNSKHFPIDQYLYDRMTPATLSPSPLAYEKLIHPTEMPCITTSTEMPVNDTNKSTPDDKYPWLDPDDIRQNMTDKEILQMKLNLKDSVLDEKGKEEFLEKVGQFTDVFSLRDEIGTCPFIEVHLKLKDETSFFVRPYPMREEQKKVIQKEMDRLTRQYRMMTRAHERYNRLFRQTHKTFEIHHLALLMFKDYITILVGTLQRIHKQYVRYESALDDTLIGIAHLNSGYLMHHILDPKILARYLEMIEDDLEETAPEFEPVFTNVYQYYGNSLISFPNTIDDLLLQLLILIKLKVQLPMSLFSIKTAPVPLDAETYLGEKREYTQIILETELIALTENNYISLMQAQISLCAKIGYMYYCEYAHLLKKCTEHTCMSAIYYDPGSDVKAKQCKTIVTFDTIPESKILDAGNLLILSNLQKPWTIACKDISRVFEIEYSTYHILNRLELCECSLTAGNYLLSYTNINCRNAPEARDGYFTTYYSFNKIVLDVIMEKFDIQVDENTKTQAALLHNDIPGYDLPTIDFVQTSIDNDEDVSILEEDNS